MEKRQPRARNQRRLTDENAPHEGVGEGDNQRNRSGGCGCSGEKEKAAGGGGNVVAPSAVRIYSRVPNAQMELCSTTYPT